MGCFHYSKASRVLRPPRKFTPAQHPIGLASKDSTGRPHRLCRLAAEICEAPRCDRMRAQEPVRRSSHVGFTCAAFAADPASEPECRPDGMRVYCISKSGTGSYGSSNGKS
jgi:hypothetical protein